MDSDIFRLAQIHGAFLFYCWHLIVVEVKELLKNNFITFLIFFILKLPFSLEKLSVLLEKLSLPRQIFKKHPKIKVKQL